MKNKFKFLVCVGLSLLMAGCSAPKAVELDGDSLITINEDLLKRKYYNVPLDPFLKETNWTYSALITKTQDGYILENDKIIKVFLVAHNADRIILNGTAERFCKIPDLSGSICTVGSEYGQEAGKLQPACIKFLVT